MLLLEDKQHIAHGVNIIVFAGLVRKPTAPEPMQANSHAVRAQLPGRARPHGAVHKGAVRPGAEEVPEGMRQHTCMKCFRANCWA